MDKIRLKGIDAHAHVGVPDSERAEAQPVSIDLELELDLSEAGWSDQVHLTADYAAVESAVLRLAEKGERKLIESLAEQIAELVLKTQPRVDAVTVTVTKRPDAMPRTREVAVELRRERERDDGSL